MYRRPVPGGVHLARRDVGIEALGAQACAVHEALVNFHGVCTFPTARDSHRGLIHEGPDSLGRCWMSKMISTWIALQLLSSALITRFSTRDEVSAPVLQDHS